MSRMVSQLTLQKCDPSPIPFRQWPFFSAFLLKLCGRRCHQVVTQLSTIEVRRRMSLRRSPLLLLPIAGEDASLGSGDHWYCSIYCPLGDPEETQSDVLADSTWSEEAPDSWKLV